MYLFHQFDTIWEYYYEEGVVLMDSEALSLLLFLSFYLSFFLVMFYIIKGLAVCWFVVLFWFWWGFFPQKTKQIFSKKAATTKALKYSWPLLRYPRQTLIRAGKII